MVMITAYTLIKCANVVWNSSNICTCMAKNINKGFSHVLKGAVTRARAPMGVCVYVCVCARTAFISLNELL